MHKCNQSPASVTQISIDTNIPINPYYFPKFPGKTGAVELISNNNSLFKTIKYK